MKLTITQWKDLATVLDSIPQKDLPTTADVRKSLGATNQIRKAIKEPIAEYDKINEDIRKVMEPYQVKLRALDQKEKDKVNALIDEANKKIEPHNKKLQKLNEKYDKEEIDIEMDENYKSFIKTNWEDKIRPAYNDRTAMIAVADAFNI